MLAGVLNTVGEATRTLFVGLREENGKEFTGVMKAISSRSSRSSIISPLSSVKANNSTPLWPKPAVFSLDAPRFTIGKDNC